MHQITRSTFEYEAARLMSLTCLSPHTAGSTVRSPAASIEVAERSFTLPLGQCAVRHWREPDIGIEADLMARMARQHGSRAAAKYHPRADPATRSNSRN